MAKVLRFDVDRLSIYTGSPAYQNYFSRKLCVSGEIVKTPTLYNSIIMRFQILLAVLPSFSGIWAAPVVSDG